MSDNPFRAPEGSEELDAVNYAADARERGAPRGQIEMARLTRPATQVSEAGVSEIDRALAAVAPAGMTPAQMLGYVALGDRRHGDAPKGECGAVDPRRDDESRWCRRPDDGRCARDGWHCRYRLDEDWPTEGDA